MNEQVSEVAEVKVEVPERRIGDGIIAAGARGEGEGIFISDRARKKQYYQGRVDYRECIPCDRCGNCFELRGFTKAGKEGVVALYCLMGDYETTAWHTCNVARRMKKGRKKVAYLLENAPVGWKLAAGIESEVRALEEEGGSKKVEPSMPLQEDGYQGGSKYYKRADASERVTEEGDERIPRSLRN